MSESWNESYDLVVIGSGAGAISAAIVAAVRGASCAVFEKTDKLGGSTALSGGVIWIPNNPVMARVGIADSPEHARAYLAACAATSGVSSPEARREAFLREGPNAVKLLERLGMQFVLPVGLADYHEGEFPGAHGNTRSLIAKIFDLNRLGPLASRMRRHVKGREMPVGIPDLAALAFCGGTTASKLAYLRVGWRLARNRMGCHLVGVGAALYGRLLEIAIRLKVNLRTEAPVTEILTDGYRVAGVAIREGAVSRRVQARQGVLIASGGFSRSAEMRRRFHQQPSSVAWSMSNPGDTGEIQMMATKLGGAIDNMDVCVWNSVSMLPDGSPVPVVGDHKKPHSILVDCRGRRFVNESGSYVAIGLAAYERNKETTCVPCWMIMDHQHRQKYRFAYVAPGREPEEWYESGFLCRANTLAELAGQCGIDKDQLLQTIEKFNQSCLRGVDEEFHRGRGAYDRFYGDPRSPLNFSLGTINQPPFYAAKVFQGDVGTYGGLVSDEFARVLRSDGSAIEGLYATGNATASVMGRSYPGAGASIAASLVFGYIAANHSLAS